MLKGLAMRKLFLNRPTTTKEFKEWFALISPPTVITKMLVAFFRFKVYIYDHLAVGPFLCLSDDLKHVTWQPSVTWSDTLFYENFGCDPKTFFSQHSALKFWNKALCTCNSTIGIIVSANINVVNSDLNLSISYSLEETRRCFHWECCFLPFHA